MHQKPGSLYWITGLSGAGKTTIGKALYDQLKSQKPNVVFLDGDVLRSVFDALHGHSVEDRNQLARSYSNLCKILTDRGIDVVCSTISLFREVHEFNRSAIENYFEVFVECDMQELIRRDQKAIYSNAMKGKLSDVVGVNMPYDRPEYCDLVIDNTGKNNIQGKIKAILNIKLVQLGDFSNLAKQYINRAAYNDHLLKTLLLYTGYLHKPNFRVAEIGPRQNMD